MEAVTAIPGFSYDAPESRPAGAAGVRILLVEDNAADADVVLDYFEADDPASATRVELVDRLASALASMGTAQPDVVLLDLSLPDASGLEGLRVIAARHPDVPIVVMTGLADERMALEAVKAGAQDYLSKGMDGPRVVRRAVRYAMERQRMRLQLKDLLAREREARAAAERAVLARNEMLGIVSHDLRNPLSAVIMAASGMDTASPGDRDKLVGIIKRSSEWGMRIIRDLVDVSAIEAGQLPIHPEPMTVLAIAEMLHDMFEGPAASAGVTLLIDMDRAPRWITADVDRLVQAVGNLVTNAIKFTPRAGIVRLTIASGPDATIRFHVSDTGPGIPAEHLPHLFDRFWQGRKSLTGGVGLGLAIARGIAGSHGGTIDVDSALGAGTTFTLTIPIGDVGADVS